MRRTIAVTILTILLGQILSFSAFAVPILYGVTNASGTGGGGGTGGGTGTDAGSDLVIVNQGTGALSIVGSVGIGRVSGLALDSSTNTLFGTGGNPTFNPFDFNTQLLDINRTTGAGTPIGPTNHDDPPIGSGGNISDLAIAADGTLFGYSPTDLPTGGSGMILDVLLDIDKGTGAATQVGQTNLGNDGQGDFGGNGMTFDSSGRLVLANEFFLNELDTTTGINSILANLDYTSPFFDVTDPNVFFVRAGALATHPITGEIFASVIVGSQPGLGGPSPTAFLATLDQNPNGSFPGTFTYIGPTDAKLDALAFVDVPEPSTLVLLGLGLLGVGYSRRPRPH